MEQPKADRVVEEPIYQQATPVEEVNGRAIPQDGRALQRLYELRTGEVELYLREFPFLVGLLMDAAQPLGRHFPDARLSLEVVDDPEADDRQLALLIASPLPSEELVERLRRFDDEWCIERLPSALDRLFITLGFE